MPVISIDLILMEGTQSRAALNEETLAEYAEKWQLPKSPFPPVKVFVDKDKNHWLADGFHRVISAQRAKRSSIVADVVAGSQEDALLYSLAANQEHGLRRTNDDKQRIVRTMLNHPEWVKWTDNRIAEHVGVTQPFVSAIRKQLITVINSPAAKSADQPREGKDGKTYKPKTDKGLRNDSISEKGKPGGVGASSETPPASSGPVTEEAADSSGEDERTDSTGQEAQETDPRPPRSGKERNSAPGKVDYGKCPNCAGVKWTDDEFGVTCSKCHHPHGEVVDRQPEEVDHAGTLRSKCVKTVEALMRAVDDLHLLVPKAGTHKQCIELCKSLLKSAKSWK